MRRWALFTLFAASAACRSRNATTNHDTSQPRTPPAPAPLSAPSTARHEARALVSKVDPRVPAREADAPRSEELALDRLPSVEPVRCAEGGNGVWRGVFSSLRKPILEALEPRWAEMDYAPRGCIGAVQALCAPELDGTPGDELLVKINYRVAQDGVQTSADPLQPPCNSPERVDPSVVVAISPPAPGRVTWTPRGVVGFVVRGAGEGGSVIEFKRFVRLPGGSTGVYAREFTPGFTKQEEVVLVYSKEQWFWETAHTRSIR